MSDNFKKGEWVDGHWTPSDDDDELLVARHGAGLSPENRALLELAARALGARFEEVEHEGYGNLQFEDGRVVNAWNSLAFSGDALELAVNLGISLENSTAGCIATGFGDERAAEFDADDAISATRRAITRAAAEIGKQRST